MSWKCNKDLLKKNAHPLYAHIWTSMKLSILSPYYVNAHEWPYCSYKSWFSTWWYLSPRLVVLRGASPLYFNIMVVLGELDIFYPARSCHFLGIKSRRQLPADINGSSPFVLWSVCTLLLLPPPRPLPSAPLSCRQSPLSHRSAQTNEEVPPSLIMLYI